MRIKYEFDRLRESIGVGGRAVDWPRVVICGLTLLASEVLAWLLWWPIGRRCPEPWGECWSIYAQMESRCSFGFICVLVVAFAAIAAIFRLLRGIAWPVLASALVGGLASLAVQAQNIHLATSRYTTLPEAIPALGAGFIGCLLLVSGLMFALRWQQRPAIAFPLGMVTAFLITRLLGFSGWTPYPFFECQYPPVVVRWFDLPFRLFQAVLFGTLLMVARPLAEPSNRPLSKRLFLGSFLGGSLLAFAMLLAARSYERITWGRFDLTLLGGIFICGGCAVVMAALLYKMWAAIQDGHARTTSGKAAGLMFVPLFNLYWVFQAYWGFARDYNAYVQRHALSLPRLPAGLFLVYIVLIYLGFLPHVGSFLIMANLLVGAALINKICDAVNALPMAARQAGNGST